MTTRSVLFRLLFWTMLGTMTVVGALSFFQFRSALRSEIAGNLRFGATAMMQRIDTFLFAHVENMRVWRGLEVMQDIRVKDVDKRLSNFLSNLRAGQDTVYDVLLCTDAQGRVVAASDPSYIGGDTPRLSGWRNVPGQGLDAVSMALVSPGAGTRAIVLRSPIVNAFGEGTIGYLYVFLDWRAVQRLLDGAVNRGARNLLLIDRDGHVLGASASLRNLPGLSRLRLDGWLLPGTGAASYVHDGAGLGYGDLLVGAATSGGYPPFEGMGWHTLMIEPTSVSFGPIWALLWAMVGVLLVTLLTGLWISSRLADRIASPIVALTAFTRSFRQGQALLPTMPSGATSEVDELHRAYTEMIQALEQSREQIVRAGKLAVVGEMAAIMAHEVRTPMGILRSSAQLLQRQADLDERQRELIGFIFSETERLNRLVTLLLECARPNPPDFMSHDLLEIVDSVIALLESRAERAGVSLSRQSDGGDVVLRCDREQMMQVFLNLILNALSFVGEGGRIRVSTHRDEDALWVSVADDGPGVPVELRQRIFDPFFSRREGGIGLGLTIVQQIVQAHGGTLSVGESAWGGASFNLRFNHQEPGT
ncbi:signal transduction histidine kinase [Luteibacter jiangsuensis]|uniref:histidine kinase n=1 Tax=Luteibacter jiangsuensis TaxID=637577 RepID=A0ABT9SVA3_9GAMM|nr:PAS domain-containing sensor histidine kinase [Luteibacter jiangsuensis]MDQ0008316.1 signal transduction histidine kinase [Luteibacter jiangsuensis]